MARVVHSSLRKRSEGEREQGIGSRYRLLVVLRKLYPVPFHPDREDLRMSKKDYEIVAECIARVVGCGLSVEQFSAVRDVVMELAFRFEEENDRFDIEKFIDAALPDSIVKGLAANS